MSFDRKTPVQRCSPSAPLASRSKQAPLRVGGQAVIEGVMMRSPNSMAVAVRKPNGEIVVKQERLSFFAEGTWINKLPLVRGTLALLGAMILGIRALTFSANHALSDSDVEKRKGKGKGKDPGPWTIGFTIAAAPSRIRSRTSMPRAFSGSQRSTSARSSSSLKASGPSVSRAILCSAMSRRFPNMML